MAGKRIALSWSGGKDSCMTLDKLAKAGEEVACLLTTVPREIGRTFGHGERTELIAAQADALGLPAEFIACSFDSYTEDYVARLGELKAIYGLEAIAFGDLFLAEHREWGTRVAERVGLEALYPLWMPPGETGEALKAFVASGYRAVVIRVRDEALSPAWLGRELDARFYADILLERNVCPMGEGGEYHTFVYDGPLFRKAVDWVPGERLRLETTTRLDIGPPTA
ncbi:Dph6-related ATP pyrophosphatase [Cohnella nanjingensis]|uniref:Diphthine--ammonia ligase n=1 Tax=Cohnella nanjingensis TaxID=1387779 RepID=A0A7X0RLX7_9BACL|nr:diphthine--ammonia ligase [Cohnella nanjingensis]MBB6669887.1 diphthine--ammonia ligase [Cohnella nanjingensis]